MSGTIVTFTNITSNTVLDLSGGQTGNNVPIVGWQANGGTNQQWRLVKVADRGVWPIYKLQNVASGTYIDLQNTTTTSNVPVTGCDGPADASNERQNWFIMGADPFGELVKIKNVASSTHLDVYGGNSANGTKINGWESGDDWTDPVGTHQVWRMKRV